MNARLVQSATDTLRKKAKQEESMYLKNKIKGGNFHCRKTNHFFKAQQLMFKRVSLIILNQENMNGTCLIPSKC